MLTSTWQAPIRLSCRRAQVRGEKRSEAALFKASRVNILAAIASDGANTWGRPLPSALAGQRARSSIIPSPDSRIVYPAQGRETEGQEKQTGPRARRLPLGPVQLVRARTRSRTANFLHHFAYFEMILTYFRYRPPTGSRNCNSPFPLSAGIALSSPIKSTYFGDAFCIFHCPSPFPKPICQGIGSWDMTH